MKQTKDYKKNIMSKTNMSVMDLQEVALENLNESIFTDSLYSKIAEEIADSYNDNFVAMKAHWYGGDGEYMWDKLVEELGTEDFDDSEVDYDRIWNQAYRLNCQFMYDVQAEASSVREAFEEHLIEVIDNDYEQGLRSAIEEAKSFGVFYPDMEDYMSSYLFDMNLVEEFLDWYRDFYGYRTDSGFYLLVEEAGSTDLSDFVIDYIESKPGIESVEDRGTENYELEITSALWVANPFFEEQQALATA